MALSFFCPSIQCFVVILQCESAAQNAIFQLSVPHSKSGWHSSKLSKKIYGTRNVHFCILLKLKTNLLIVHKPRIAIINLQLSVVFEWFFSLSNLTIHWSWLVIPPLCNRLFISSFLVLAFKKIFVILFNSSL